MSRRCARSARPGPPASRFGSRSSASPRFAGRLHGDDRAGGDQQRRRGPRAEASRRGRSTLTGDIVPCLARPFFGICKETKEERGRRQRRSTHALPSPHHRRCHRHRRGAACPCRRRAGSRDRGAAGVAALEGDVLRQDRRPRRPDDGEGPARVPARRRAAGDRGAGAANARSSSARSAGRSSRAACSSRAPTAGTSPRCSSCSPGRGISGCSTSTATSAPRRRPACSASSARAGSRSTGSPARRRSRPSATGGATPVLTQATSSAVSYVVRPGDTLTEIAAEAQDDRARARRRKRPRVGEPRRRGREAPSARSGGGRAGAGAEPLDRACAHRQVGGALRRPVKPRPGACVAGVRLPDERHLVDGRLGADADHAGHLDVRRNRPARPHGAADGRGRRRGRAWPCSTTCSSASTATSGSRSPPGTRASGPCASAGSTTRRRCSSRTCSRSRGRPL